MLPFDEARTRLLSNVLVVGAERVPLRDSVGRVLSESVQSISPIPPLDVSAMDGFAVAFADLRAGASWHLPVAGESRTGAPPPSFSRGTACRIFTGAALPTGADTVIMQEDVELIDGAAVSTFRPSAGAHVRTAGCDLRAGARVLDVGTRIAPGHLALLASVEKTEVAVSRRPRVSILCTGDELRASGEAPRVASIPESNSVALAAMVHAVGGIARVCPLVRDEQADTERAIDHAMEGADLLVTVGGVSVGDHDVVRPALVACGVSIDFWKVSIKPGKPLAVGRKGSTHVLGLPGNPASALVTFALFAAPLIRALAGDVEPLPLLLTARVASSIRHKPGRMEFVRVKLVARADGLSAVPLDNQSSGAVTSMAWGDALAIVPLESGEVPAGTDLRILRLSDV